MNSVELNREGRVLRITLAREDKRNALNLEMCRAIVHAAHEAESDLAIGCILVDARGSTFCAGMDLDEALDRRDSDALHIHEQLFTLPFRLSKPIVMAVQGAALGGGMGLAANGHVVVAAQGAKFGLTEIRIGMWPYVVFRAVSRAVTERRAVELALTGRVFGTNEALMYGLVHEVAPAFELDDRATAIAQTIASYSPVTISRGLSFLREAHEMKEQAVGELALRLRMENFKCPDFAEGVTAFREKRAPQWPSLKDLESNLK